MCSFFFWLVCDRTPTTRDFPGNNYPSDEEWHGYINDNDRVLLKVVCIFILHVCLKFKLIVKRWLD